MGEDLYWLVARIHLLPGLFHPTISLWSHLVTLIGQAHWVMPRLLTSESRWQVRKISKPQRHTGEWDTKVGYVNLTGYPYNLRETE